MKRMDQINVIPFIDIMLVLLAIVLTTATFIVEGRLQIRLPAASSQTMAPAVERLEIAIDAAGGLYLGGEPIGIGADGLGALEPRLDAVTLDTPIVLRVDAQTRFEQFIAVVDRLKGRGLERLTILTRRP
jgi:biopolymer transport protein ExbD